VFYLVVGILVFEILRLVLQIRESKRVNDLNKRVLENLNKQFEETQVIRKAEIEELKELAKGSKFLEGFITGLENKGEGK
jgi:uncharacterized membrane protein (Fun14 family)